MTQTHHIQIHPLRARREARNFTRERLALEAGVGASTIKRAERGETISPYSRQQLCAYFGCSAEELGLLPVDLEQNDTPLVSGDMLSIQEMAHVLIETMGSKTWRQELASDEFCAGFALGWIAGQLHPNLTNSDERFSRIQAFVTQ